MAKKENAFRFGVKSSDGKSSGIYRIWGNGKGSTSDIYFSIRTIAGILKISFHESGDYRSAFTQQYVEKEIEKGTWNKNSRILDRWQCQNEIRPRAKCALRLAIPTRTLIEDVNRSKENGKIYWISPKTGDTITEIDIFFIRPDSEDTRLPGIPLAALELPNQNVVCVSMLQYEMNDKIETILKKFHFSIESENGDITTPRAVIFGNDEDETRWLVETIVSKKVETKN